MCCLHVYCEIDDSAVHVATTQSDMRKISGIFATFLQNRILYQNTINATVKGVLQIGMPPQ